MNPGEKPTRFAINVLTHTIVFLRFQITTTCFVEFAGKKNIEHRSKFRVVSRANFYWGDPSSNCRRCYGGEEEKNWKKGAEAGAIKRRLRKISWIEPRKRFAFGRADAEI